MLKIADFYSDGGRHLKARFPILSKLPPFMANLTAPSPDLPDDDFALVVKEGGSRARYWPITDKANTWLSALYFDRFHSVLEKSAAVRAAQSLLEACHVFSLLPPASVRGCAHGEIPQRQKRASAQPTLPGGLPAGNRVQCLASQEKILEHWDRIDPGDRRKIASLLVKLAAVHVFRVEEQISAYALPDRDESKIAGAIGIRVQHFDPLNGLKVQQAYTKAASATKEAGVDATIAAFRDLDEHLELTTHWGRGIPDPVVSVTGHVKKAEYSWCHGNTHVTQRDLELLPQSAGYSALEESFGPNLARRLMDRPVATFKTLDEHRKLIVARLAGYSLSNEGANRKA